MAKAKDSLQDEFDKTMKKLKAINKPISLIENGEYKKDFEANGVKYSILPADKVFNIGRQTAFYNIDTAFSLNQTPTSIKQRFSEMWHTIIRLMSVKGAEHSKLMEKLVTDAMNNDKSFKGELTNRYPAAYYLCTLFIIREGEDLQEWNFEAANKKIDDWVAANIRAVDFFGLALASSKECQRIIELESE